MKNKMNLLIRENLLFLIISFIAFNQNIALVRAQEYEYNPHSLNQSLNLARGVLAPNINAGFYLDYEDSCHLVQKEWGWSKGACAAIDKIVLIPVKGVDTLIIGKPNSEGFVSFTDWESSDREDEIKLIWEQLEESVVAQSKRSGKSITSDGWFVYPTLNRNKSYMYYGTIVSWESEKTINLTVSKFDRSGYIEFQIVPDDSNLTKLEAASLISNVMEQYTPSVNQSYSQFVTGDKVAAVGVIGVLASLVGVKYGKGALAGIFAFLLLIAKKAWVLILIPFYYFKKLIADRKNKN